MDKLKHWQTSFAEAEEILSNFSADQKSLEACNQFSSWLIEAIKKDCNIFACGNGGSHCDAMHFAEELTGRYKKDRRALGALALGESSHLTCTANDFGFEHVFSRQLEGLGRANDLLIALSTSGNSQNVLQAVGMAKKKSLRTVGLLGKDGGQLKNQVDLAIVVPSANTARIQELHIKILHMAIAAMEAELFG
jgi:D-sedoheptulose 7-phosphate isomerase